MLQQFLPITHMRLCTFWLLLSDSSKLVQLDLHSLEREREITSNKWLVKASCCLMWIIEPKLPQRLGVPGDQRCRRAEADTVSVQVTGPPFQLPIRDNEDPSNSPSYFPRKWQDDEVSQECLRNSMWCCFFFQCRSEGSIWFSMLLPNVASFFLSQFRKRGFL